MTYESIFAVIGMPVIGILSLVGVALPSIIAFCFPKYGLTKKLYFTFFNGIAAGLILAVGWIHSLPDSQKALSNVLTDDESQVESYPWFAFIAMMAALITYSVEELVEVLTRRWGLKNLHGHSPTYDDIEKRAPKGDETTTSRSEEDEPCEDNSDEKKKESGNEYEHALIPGVLPLTKMLALLIGLLFHNFFIGIGLGISDNDYSLFIALICHQFFEGLGLGARVALANLRSVIYVLVIDTAFALSCPIGIGVGMAMKTATEDDDYTYSIFEGVFQGISGGILIYIALVHMLRAYTEIGSTSSRLELHRLFSYLGVLFGVAVMSVIGIWA